MILELDIRRCVSEEAEPKRGVDTRQCANKDVEPRRGVCTGQCAARTLGPKWIDYGIPHRLKMTISTSSIIR